MADSEKALNSVSKIDTVSRIVFPATYIVINIIYWYMYLDRSERIAVTTEDWGGITSDQATVLQLEISERSLPFVWQQEFSDK